MRLAPHSRRRLDIRDTRLCLLLFWAGTSLPHKLLELLFLLQCTQCPLGRSRKCCSSSLLLQTKTFPEGKLCQELRNHQLNRTALPDTATFFLTRLGNKILELSNAGNH